MKLTTIVFCLTFWLSLSMQSHANELSRIIPEHHVEIKVLVTGAAACALGVSYLVDMALSKPLKNLLELHYYQKKKGRNAQFFSFKCIPSCGFTVEEQLPNGSRVRTRSCGYLLDTSKTPPTWSTKAIYTTMSLALIAYGVGLLKDQLPIILKRA